MVEKNRKRLRELLERKRGHMVTTKPNLSHRDFSAEARVHRRSEAKGEITGHSDSHGLCFKVTHHDLSTAFYDPDELEDLTDPAAHQELLDILQDRPTSQPRTVWQRLDES